MRMPDGFGGPKFIDFEADEGLKGRYNRESGLVVFANPAGGSCLTTLTSLRASLEAVAAADDTYKKPESDDAGTRSRQGGNDCRSR